MGNFGSGTNIGDSQFRRALIVVVRSLGTSENVNDGLSAGNHFVRQNRVLARKLGVDLVLENPKMLYSGEPMATRKRSASRLQRSHQWPFAGVSKIR